MGLALLGCDGNRIPDAPKTTISESESTYMEVSFEFVTFNSNKLSKLHRFVL